MRLPRFTQCFRPGPSVGTTLRFAPTFRACSGGGEELVEHVEKKLGIKQGESTEDGRIYLKREEECLAACCGAPMMMVDHKYYENLTTEAVDEILDGLE